MSSASSSNSSSYVFSSSISSSSSSNSSSYMFSSSSASGSGGCIEISVYSPDGPNCTDVFGNGTTFCNNAGYATFCEFVHYPDPAPGYPNGYCTIKCTH